jgi:hypothetical protein
MVETPDTRRGAEWIVTLAESLLARPAPSPGDLPMQESTDGVATQSELLGAHRREAVRRFVRATQDPERDDHAEPCNPEPQSPIAQSVGP